ncbi:tetratricopeptide repeat protein, partial [Dapis sp. BLCC M229]|uniref:tetratricopeptide repeat protein n=1 Tax=Dapis sp. BLCC M229 TaxID=3400188 RepID=UPI003CE9894E
MKGEKIAWEENSALTVEEEFEALVETIRFTEGFGLLFVECSPQQGTEIMEKIRLDIPQEKIEVLPLDKTVYNFYNRVKELPLLADIDILFVTGLEYSLYQYEEDMKERGLDNNEIISISKRGVPPVLVNLNQQRERFRDDFDICFVFLLPRFALDYLIKRAPDFFDWRSGLFQFPMNEETVRKEFLAISGKELDDYIEFTRQERKYEWVRIKSLLDEDRFPFEEKANLLVRKASLDRRLKQNEEAILACDEALEIEPNNYEAWNNKGIALENLERYEEAILVYEKAIEINPNYHKFWKNKGDALDSLESYEQAIAAYDKAIELKADY